MIFTKYSALTLYQDNSPCDIMDSDVSNLAVDGLLFGFIGNIVANVDDGEFLDKRGKRRVAELIQRSYNIILPYFLDQNIILNIIKTKFCIIISNALTSS